MRMTRSFWKSRSGNVAMMFGLLLVPMLLGAGMAIDFARQNIARNLITESLDAASLRLAMLPDLEDPEFTQMARDIFEANLGDRFRYSVNSFSAVRGQEGNIVVSADVNVIPTFIRVAGINELNVSQSSEAGLRDRKGLELVVAFDTTASMGFGNTWDTALDTVSDVLLTLSSYTGDADFYVSIIPFSDRVPVGTDKTAWLPGAAPVGWNGCVEPREAVDGSYQWALDDDSPLTDPFVASIPNVTGGLAGYNNGPRCPSVGVTGPTSNVQAVIDAAADFTAGGTGRFDVAMAWAWRMLSPKWTGLWGPADYPAVTTDDMKKVVVFVTDGRTEAYTHELSQMRSWGYNQGSVDGFDNMAYTCDRMKAEGIEIFMYRINGNPHAESYMQDCASSPEHYEFVTNNEDLAVAFRGLVVQLEGLRLYR